MNNKNTFNNKINNRNITDNSNNLINNQIQKNHSRCNSSYDRSLQQSPKIRTGKFRPQSSRPKPFSLIDFDDKRILGKSPNIPPQHERLSENELKKFISKINQKAGDNKNKKRLIQNFLNKNEKNEHNTKNNNNIDNNNKNDKPINMSKNDRVKTAKKLTIETKETYDINSIPKVNSKKLKNKFKETKNIKRNINITLNEK